MLARSVPYFDKESLMSDSQYNEMKSELKSELKAIHGTLTEYLIKQVEFQNHISAHKDAFDRAFEQIRKTNGRIDRLEERLLKDEEAIVINRTQSKWFERAVLGLFGAGGTMAALVQYFKSGN